MDAGTRLKEVCHAARARDRNAPPAFLAEVCSGDEQPHRKVEPRLVHAGQDGSFLVSPAIEVAAEAPALNDFTD